MANFSPPLHSAPKLVQNIYNRKTPATSKCRYKRQIPEAIINGNYFSSRLLASLVALRSRRWLLFIHFFFILLQNE